MIDKKRMYDVMVRMVEAPSISGTADEMSAVDRIEELLYEIPYFAAHRENVMRVPLQDDPLDRELICAYLELAPDCPDTDAAQNCIRSQRPDGRTAPIRPAHPDTVTSPSPRCRRPCRYCPRSGR